jgi:nucleotide-binding universal stress UspA family protein
MTSSILVPIDFSPHSDRALDWAIELAKPDRGKIHLAHALHFPHELRMTGTWWSTLRGQVVERLDACADRVEKAGLTYQVHLPEEHPVEAILKMAESTRADLIVMGAHGTRRHELFLGSVATRVMRLARCPVMIVKN